MGLRSRGAWRWLSVALLVVVGLSLVVVWLEAEHRHSERLRRDLIGSWERRVAAIELLSTLKDAETAQRGYLLTGDPAFLAPYAPARSAAERMLAVPEDVRASPAQRARHAAIIELAGMKFAEMERTIDERRRGDPARSLALVATGRGKALMDRLRVLVGAAVAEETIATERRREEAEAQRRRLNALVLAVLCVLGAAIVAAAWLLWRSAAARSAALAQAREANARNLAILDGTADAILILNPSGTIETINAAAERLLGYRSAELERRDIAALVDLAPGEGSFHRRIGLVEGRLERPYRTDCEVRAKSGEMLPFDIAMGVMRVPSGDHIVLSLRDIAERKRVERVKDELISTVSHELRTPLTSVVGALGLIGAGAAGALPEAAERLIAIADGNARRLIRVINDMLDIDRIEAGRLRLNREPVDLRQAARTAAAAAGDARVQLDLAEAPVLVEGDVERLVQIATNLLSNALRVSLDDAPVILAVSTGPDGSAMLSVADRGPGIPASFRTRIFGRFERAEGQEATTGTGLGLAISREIAVLHGGALDYVDRTGGGTRFTLTMPLLGGTGRSEDAARVLICEPDPVLAARLAGLVAGEGCASDIVADSAAARTALAAHAYAALLIDLSLPQEGGLAFAHALRDGEPPFAGPMIVVAGAAGHGEAGMAAIDVVDWIVKPVDGDRLATALRTAIARGNADHPTVLHLDDDPDLLDIVALSLQPEVRIVKVRDLASARALIAVSPPDVAIVDVQLADESGLSLLPDLIDRDGRPIPTVLYTAQDVPAEVARRVDAVLVKARGSLPDLKATLRRILRETAR